MFLILKAPNTERIIWGVSQLIEKKGYFGYVLKNGRGMLFTEKYMFSRYTNILLIHRTEITEILS